MVPEAHADLDVDLDLRCADPLTTLIDLSQTARLLVLGPATVPCTTCWSRPRTPNCWSSAPEAAVGFPACCWVRRAVP